VLRARRSRHAAQHQAKQKRDARVPDGHLDPTPIDLDRLADKVDANRALQRLERVGRKPGEQRALADQAVADQQNLELVVVALGHGAAPRRGRRSGGTDACRARRFSEPLVQRPADGCVCARDGEECLRCIRFGQCRIRSLTSWNDIARFRFLR
jgi:hypothetical protein